MAGELFVYVACASEREAEKIGASAVEKRLAACANVLGSGKSFYWWKGKAESASECFLVLKTTRKRFAQLERLVKAMHSYENPAIVALPIVLASRSYSRWISGSVK